MFASEVFLGVRPAREYLYVVIASPVGSYFAGGVKPVTVWVSPDYTRAAPGGTGAAKCGGNYAASLVAQAEAIEHGCDQVVFLDAVERRNVDELGGMNIFFVYDDGAIVTPPLRHDPAGHHPRLRHARWPRDAGHEVVERPVSFDEWQADAASGRLREAFACGTAAVITPIGTVRHPRRRVHDGRRRHGRRDRAAASVPCGHPARPGGRPVRLGAADRLVEQVVAQRRDLVGGDARVPGVTLDAAVPRAEVGEEQPHRRGR